MDQQKQSPPSPKKEKKTIYDVSYGSIFARNFLAGFSRTIGGLFVYILLGGFIYYLALTYVLPGIKSAIPDFSKILGPPGEKQQIPTNLISPEQLEGALDYMQQNQESQPQPEKAP